MTPPDDEKVSKEVFEYHIAACQKGWSKVDDMYDLILKLRLRTYLIIGFLAGSTGYSIGNKDVIKSVFAAMFGSHG